MLFMFVLGFLVGIACAVLIQQYATGMLGD